MIQESDKQKHQMLLDEQKEAVETLLRRHGTVEAVASAVGVCTDSVSLWRKKKRVAKGLARQKLFGAINSPDKSGTVKLLGSNRGRKLTKGRRSHLQLELKKLKLAPPNVRAATLRALLSKSGLTITAMAKALLIHENTLKYYLDPECENLMKPATAKNIVDFAKQVKNGRSKVSLQYRLEAALEKLIGKELVEEGFFDWDPRRALAAIKISSFTGLHNRTVRRYFPPITNKRFPQTVVEAFEEAAVELGNILESK